jgi:hypothetical protein
VGSFQASRCDLINERRIVITTAGAIDAPRHWLHANAIIGSRSKEFGPIGAIQPGFDIRIVE